MYRFWWMGIPALLILCPLALGFSGDSNEKIRTITVIGTGEVKVKPDKVVVALGVSTFSAKLSEAKKDADGRMTRILALMNRFNIETKDYRTDHVSIAPQYKYEEDSERRDKLLGYEVSNNLVVTLRQVNKLGEFLEEAIEAGATHVHGVSFQTTELRKHRDEARKLAIRAAREKALLLSGEIGQKIGLAREITEKVDDGYVPVYAQTNQAMSGGGSGGGRYLNDDGDHDRTMAAGEISVRSTVSVVFDLE